MKVTNDVEDDDVPLMMIPFYNDGLALVGDLMRRRELTASGRRCPRAYWICE
jgi:hypothetical protein